MAVQIKGFIENSLIEWEGMISSIVFLSGCNFRCSYCHSPHLVNPTEDLETIPMEAVIGYLKKKRGWVDGVVVSGGLPSSAYAIVGPIALKIKTAMTVNESRDVRTLLDMAPPLKTQTSQ